MVLVLVRSLRWVTLEYSEGSEKMGECAEMLVLVDAEETEGRMGAVGL